MMKNLGCKATTSIGMTIENNVPILHFTGAIKDKFPVLAISLEQDSLDPHSQSFVELVYVDAGSGVHIHGRNKYPIFAGDCFVVLPGEQHGYENIRSLSISNVLFDAQVVSNYAASLKALPGFTQFFAIEPLIRSETAFKYKLHLDLNSRREVAEIARQITIERHNENPGYELLCISLLIRLIVLISRAYQTQISSKKGVREQFGHQQDTVETAIAYLESNYANECTIDDISRAAFISPSRLSHVFKEKTGQTLSEYLGRLRIDQAIHILLNTNHSIADIASATGFDSPDYFSRCFKKTTGYTPKAYRKKAGLSGK
jgi:AraC family L-rhamnose operon transcriptional activator RhaR